MKKHVLTRRQFAARCAAFGLAFPALGSAVAARANVPGAGSGRRLGAGRTAKTVALV